MFLRSVYLAIALLAFASTPSNADSPSSPEDLEELPTTLSLTSAMQDPSMHLVKDYILGDPAAQQKTYVKVFQSNTKPSGSTLAKRDSSPPTTPLNGGKHIDLTPAPCTSKACYPGSFAGPHKTDCDVIVAAQFNSTGLLTAFPGTWVFVHSGTCVVVFQHPVGKPEYNYILDYKWSSLGNIMLELMKKCMSKPSAQSIGGACKIKRYQEFKFQNVLISLQTYIDPTQ
ncbi:hypothetical protein PCASD_01526 [Puccinia coronata f. sp. avenae]|uniref:Ecp2 effector protein domain-containing protein n=1 Tax=Puccinia coronata f. sp. avenae TaxID=200324 RepID=A0A2N5VIN4_9BASI|nr:hypothetical protein PCASD_01526 [Puccinia coronata f. sp. avenae]